MAKRLIRHPAVQGMLARLVALYLRLVWATTRWTLVGEEHARPFAEGPMILAFWHERLPLAALGWRLLGRRVPQGGRRAQVLISRHRDGRLIAAAVRPFGIDVVHASSSRGGATGLRGLARILAGGGVAVITPDGPRGPARVAAPGVAQLAALTGVPVLPCAVASTRMRLAGSWDRMRFPLPFGRGFAVVGAPVAVARDGVEDALPRIAAALTAACEVVDRLAKVGEGEPPPNPRPSP
ncbi:lysophospholipid acyltransferase family protein [Roseomonas sp. PWR1]|uniref:Lysophospholipid acyltransferase family protein n=1 Tax=Roseomonas nitratireducens TaxID=2820810 RepID=A0ABS4AS22_9PROT|nr:lysophospholipid acyltransferase family protein [Neoroseomonas nitratireducens]MBP0464155.1 lysophospholipid acyltransferase family protein [Neoroseomonas nitratireducens]